MTHFVCCSAFTRWPLGGRRWPWDSPLKHSTAMKGWILLIKTALIGRWCHGSLSTISSKNKPLLLRRRRRLDISIRSQQPPAKFNEAAAALAVVLRRPGLPCWPRRGWRLQRRAWLIAPLLLRTLFQPLCRSLSLPIRPPSAAAAAHKFHNPASEAAGSFNNCFIDDVSLARLRREGEGYIFRLRGEGGPG